MNVPLRLSASQVAQIAAGDTGGKHLGGQPDAVVGSIAFAPFLSVIIPHYNDLDNLKRCVVLLEQQSWHKDRVEIIVADNNSQCGIAAVRAAVPAARVVPAAIQGAGPARNAAVAAAKGEVFAFIDSDCFAEPDWLRQGVCALTTADYIGGQVVTTVRDPAHPSPAEAYDAVFAFNFEKYINRDKFSGTGNLFVPRQMFQSVGAFRSGVSEDVEWCHRANALGFQLKYAPDAIVLHAARHAWSDLLAKYRRVTREGYLLMREQPLGRLRWAGHALLVLLSPVVHVAHVVRSPRLAGWGPKWRGAVGLVGIRSFRCWEMWRVMLFG